jgi:hypothetical protein
MQLLHHLLIRLQLLSRGRLLGQGGEAQLSGLVSSCSSVKRN